MIVLLLLLLFMFRRDFLYCNLYPVLFLLVGTTDKILASSFLFIPLGTYALNGTSLTINLSVFYFVGLFVRQ